MPNNLRLIIALAFSLFYSFTPAQNKSVSGTLQAGDNVHLNIIEVGPDSFPDVTVVFEAIKRNGPIFGLTKKDLMVYEDQYPCEVLSVEEVSKNYPIHIAVVIDHSGSMSYISIYDLVDSATGMLKPGVVVDSYGRVEHSDTYLSPLDYAKTAVTKFIENFSSDKDSIQIIGFSTEVDVVSEFSSDKNYLNNIVDTIECDGGTAFLDALHTGVLELTHKKGIRAVVALTDGLDNSSHVSKEELIQLSTDNKIPIFNIGLGNVDTAFLSSLSKQTQGDFFHTKDPSTLKSIYDVVQKRIKSIYALNYRSTNLEEKSNRTLRIEFNVASVYLTDNLAEVDVPIETIQYINQLNEKKKRTKYLIAGLVILVSSAGAGTLIYRRSKKKKSSD